MKQLVIGAVCLFFCSTSFAGAPLNGSYTSTDLGGSVVTGRYSVSWVAASARLQIGNTLHKQSWDGLNLGTQWKMTCPTTQGAPVLLSSTVDAAGNGNETWLVTMNAGILELDGAGPWANLAAPEPVYFADFTSFQLFTTLTFDSFLVTGAVGNTQSSAMFQGFQDVCVTFSITNLGEFSSTDAGPLPAGFPGFLNPASCLAVGLFGSWGSVTNITLTIAGCTVPVEESTWGNIKTLYE